MMARLRDPRTSIQSRLAAEHYPVPSRRTNEDPSSTPEARAGDDREQTTPDRRATGMTGAETVAIVLALVIIVVLVALL